MKKVYIACAYTADTDEGVLANIISALKNAVLVAEAGAHPIIPHTALPGCETWQDAMNCCKPMLSDCDAIFLAPGWENSRGARQEHDWALEWEMQVFKSVEALRLALAEEAA